MARNREKLVRILLKRLEIEQYCASLMVLIWNKAGLWDLLPVLIVLGVTRRYADVA